MTTLAIILCFTAVLLARAASGEDSRAMKKTKGDNFTMQCNTENDKYDSLTLYARRPTKHDVLFHDGQTKENTPGAEYIKRVGVSGDMKKLMITIYNLQPYDTGLYMCMYSHFNISLVKEEREETEKDSILLIVNDVDKTLPQKNPTQKSTAMSEPLVLVFVLTGCTLLVVFALGIWVVATKVKASCVKKGSNASRDYNSVYEDMHAHRLKQ